MTGGEAALSALVAASGLHAGFQVTVSAVVYPALVRTDPSIWASAHNAHSRSIVGVVAVVYALVMGTNVWALVTNEDNVFVWLTALGSALAIGTTAFVAGPTHARLDANPDPDLIRTLMRSDKVRAAGAVFGLVAAFLAGLTLL